MTQDLIEVTQEDEAAARKFWNVDWHDSPGMWSKLPQVEQNAIKRAFARHRLASTAALRERVEVLEKGLLEARLALEPIARRVFNDNGDHTINTEPLDGDVYSACYYAARSVSDLLSERTG